VTSAGGLLTVSADGVTMLDPATGKPRWTYGRADTATVSDLVASSDGTLVGAIAVMSEGNSTAQPGQRLMVLNAVTGALVADTPLGTRPIGPLIALDSIDAVFVGNPGGISGSQVAAVAFTGPKAGQQDWLYRSKDRCEINAVSTLGSEVALSSACGTIAMLNADGAPRWTYRSPTGGAEIWPLAGSPANTVEAVIAPGPIQSTASGHVSAPGWVISLDARTGALR
jgi:outer membrane protein assembly factor BamB